MSKRTLENRGGDQGRKGLWIQTYTDRKYWPLDPRPEEVFIEDIAHALSNECRFGGHSKNFYSVAQHCVLVAVHTLPEFRAQALMHDASEAYLKDIPKPIKKYLKGYEELEQLNALVIGEAFGLELVTLPDAVHEQDDRALFTEKRDLRGPSPALWGGDVPPWDEKITAWSPEEAEAKFLLFAGALGVRKRQ